MERFTGFTNIHYFSGTPILHKDILEISFLIPPTMSSNVGYVGVRPLTVAIFLKCSEIAIEIEIENQQFDNGQTDIAIC